MTVSDDKAKRFEAGAAAGDTEVARRVREMATPGGLAAAGAAPIGVVVSPYEEYVGHAYLPREVALSLMQAGATGKLLEDLVAIALIESGMEAENYPTTLFCWDHAVYRNHDASGTVTSVDRGVWQFNDVFESQVPDADAYALYPAAKWAIKLAQPDGRGLGLWLSWTNYLKPETMAANRASSDPALQRKYRVAVDKWQRALLAIANARCAQKGIPPLPATF